MKLFQRKPYLSIHTLNGIIGSLERSVVDKTISLANVRLRITSNLGLRPTRPFPYFWLAGKLSKCHEGGFESVLIYLGSEIADEEVCTHIQRFLVHI